jgi:protein-S-isoprenylcysteine O-methyltransferase Ste14
MTTSVSTPRLRVTLLWYLALVCLAALTRPASLPAPIAGAVDALALLLAAFASLGRIWCSVFIAGRKDVELVTTGPYALCRHPLYTLSMVGGAGLGLATHSLLLTGATLLVLGALFTRASTAEDRFLAARFEQRFESYRAATPRFWPQRWREPRPETLTVRPAILWKAFVDAGAFLLLFALVVLARRIGDSGLLATPLVLP